MLYFCELFSLRNIYNKNDTISLKNEVKKIAILKLEFIINFMERFYFFQEFVDHMSKN